MYVLSETETTFVRFEKDVAAFIRAYRKRVDRLVDFWEAPKKFEMSKTDEGKPMRITLHAETGMVLNVEVL